MKIQYKGFIREKIQKDPITISPDASFYEARNIIHEKGVRHLPVVDKNNRLVGIVTDGDIRKQPLPMLPCSTSKNLTIF